MKHALITVTFLLLAAPAAPAQVCGDCNLDGRVDILDALVAARIAAGLQPVVPAQLITCDAAGSSCTISVLQALAIAQVAAGLPVIPVCGGDGCHVASEIHADPAPGVAGDANGDGVTSGTEDEFVEIVNLSTLVVDISGVTLADSTGVRHTVPPGTLLRGGGALLVFGGGAPAGMFGGSIVQTASSGSLELDDAGDTISIVEPIYGEVLESYTYGPEGGMDESILNDPEPISPGGRGMRPMVLHTTVPPALRFSPGTRADGVTGAW